NRRIRIRMMMIRARRPPPMYIEPPCPLSCFNERRIGSVTGRRYDDPSCGDVAEWLGRGLQSLVQRFESARRLRTYCALPDVSRAGSAAIVRGATRAGR